MHIKTLYTPATSGATKTAGAGRFFLIAKCFLCTQGPMMLVGIPVVGVYVWLLAPWWSVIAGISAVTAAQRVRRWRVAVACFAMPVLLALGLAGWIGAAMWIWWS